MRLPRNKKLPRKPFTESPHKKRKYENNKRISPVGSQNHSPILKSEQMSIPDDDRIYDSNTPTPLPTLPLSKMRQTFNIYMSVKCNIGFFLLDI